MPVPPILAETRFLAGDKHKSTSGWKPKKGWQMDVAVGAGIGVIGCYFLSSSFGVGVAERGIFSVVGGALGAAIGYGVACTLSGTEQVVLGVLAGIGVAIFVVVRETSGAVVAAAPSIVSALPLLA